jgi:hypothetical protein
VRGTPAGDGHRLFHNIGCGQHSGGSVDYTGGPGQLNSIYPWIKRFHDFDEIKGRVGGGFSF